MYDVPVSKHEDGYGQIRTSEPVKTPLLLEPVSEEVPSGRARKKLEGGKAERWQHAVERSPERGVSGILGPLRG